MKTTLPAYLRYVRMPTLMLFKRFRAQAEFNLERGFDGGFKKHTWTWWQ